MTRAYQIVPENQARNDGIKKARKRPKGMIELESYHKLLMDFPLIPLKSGQHHEQALKVAERLMDRRDLNAAESDYLEVLFTLVRDYENIHDHIDDPTDAGMLQHLLDSREVSAQEVSEATGIPKSNLSSVLNGKRPFSKSMMRKLADYFDVNIGLLASNI
jgi:HTH-type transcriptional regulator/antitoxin HigA